MISDILVVMFLSYYTQYIISLLFNKQQRQKIQKTNIILNDLRKKPIKSIEDQKEFINNKYPRREKFSMSWKKFFSFLFFISSLIVLIKVYYFILDYFDIQFKLWQAILIIIVFPLLINIILKKFNLEKDNLTNIIR